MAQTQAQWFEKLKSWVPDWVFQNDQHAYAVFMGLAKLMAERQVELEGLVAKTFIMQSEDEWLDTHGEERDVQRQEAESDEFYAVRIRTQSLISKCNRPALKVLVDALLTRGACVIREDHSDGPYFDRGSYFNRDTVLIDRIKDAFTILVPKQQHAPYSFFDREYFFDRSDYIGETESSSEIYDAIIKAVNDAKAFGVLYRIYESSRTTIL